MQYKLQQHPPGNAEKRDRLPRERTSAVCFSFRYTAKGTRKDLRQMHNVAGDRMVYNGTGRLLENDRSTTEKEWRRVIRQTSPEKGITPSQPLLYPVGGVAVSSALEADTNRPQSPSFADFNCYWRRLRALWSDSTIESECHVPSVIYSVKPGKSHQCRGSFFSLRRIRQS